jgi:hypothetical protein
MVSFDFGLVQEAGKSSRFARNDRFGVVIPNVERDLAKLNNHPITIFMQATFLSLS